MAELNITERQVGDVTVLDMDGGLRIGEGCLALRNVVRRLADEGNRKLVLNLGGVRYFDSSGNGELITSYTYVARRNGQLKLANLTQKVQDILVITKLLTVYDTYDSVDEAVRSFTADNKYMTCPVYGCHNSIPFSPEFYPITLCRNCGTEISVILSAENNQVSVRTLILPTYDNEQIKIEVGTPITIRIVGRLDLFASEVLERAWLTIPKPRRVMFQLDPLGEVNPAGIQRLLALCGSRAGADRGVVMSLPRDRMLTLPFDASVYADEKTAIEALGDLPDNPDWVLDLVSVKNTAT